MNFCVISPTVGLEHYATRSKYHMVLAHQYYKDEAYMNFYRKRREAGDFIILDNGVYEGSYNEADYLEVIRWLEPDVAVLPDIICKSIESTKRSLDFLKKYAPRFPFVQWMFIPQGETLANWQTSFNCLQHFDEIADVWLGLTRFLPTHVCKGDPMIRVKLAAQIKALYPWLTIHCMGIANGDVKELKVLAQQNFVKSIDSSAPVWRGWRGFALADRDLWNEYGEDVDFSALEPPTAFKAFIESNLEVVFGICNRV